MVMFSVLVLFMLLVGIVSVLVVVLLSWFWLLKVSVGLVVVGVLLKL